MIEGKYSFKFGKESAKELADVFTDSLHNHKTALYYLCALTLERFVVNLRTYANTATFVHMRRIGKQKKALKSFNLNKKEALAFFIMYKNNYIDTQNNFVREIFTAIDRTK